MAIVIILALVTSLLIFATSYMKTVHYQSKRNTIELGAVQADFLAEGVTQLAMLKLQRLPGPLYYASVASAAGIMEPYKEYISDKTLNDEIATPCSAIYRTSYRLLPSKLYDSMNVRIAVVVSVKQSDGFEYSRKIERTITGERHPAF